MEIIFWIFVCAASVQALIYSIVFGSLAFGKKHSSNTASEPVSVVISARNEERNLFENLPLILEQNHPDFEVIVVDDCSYDDTQDVLRAFSEKYDNIRITTVKETAQFFGGKKFAVTLGIKAAKNELIVFTDADCKPSSKEWLSALSNGFSNGKEIVLGYGGYENKGGLLNMLIRFDTIYIAIKYLSFAKMGVPYMGVGRNMAYRKDLFFKNKGFASHQHLKSGDDDLFVNETGNSKNTEVVIGSLVNTISKPKESFKEWFHQKRRHLTTGTSYKISHLILLGVLSGSVVAFYTAFLILIIIGFQWQIVLGLFAIRTLIQLVIFYQSEKKMGENGVWYCAPLFEILLMIIYPIFALSNLFIKPGKWKTI
ncbi:MAG: glycosyltransferase [Flavobacteriales bacterium]|nr:glycosyltransferase [Flavobacteriales bacterium]